ncbi:hypothetical protein [Sphingomonas sp. 2378]|uniref:hypothetical protein n=1 Tax=Sphingomonas sp. 2378 TaxID=1219748 RepID=UPI00311B3E3D
MRMGIWSRGIAILSLVVAAIPGAAQDRDSPKGSPGRDVVVQGERLPSPQAPPPPGITVQSDRIVNRTLDEKAQMFVRCAPFFPPKVLRRAIDGQPNRPTTLLAMDSFIRANQACWPDMPSPPLPPPPDLASCWQVYTVTGLPVCRSNYDRGAVLEAAIARFAPDAALTAQEVDEPAAIARLEAREKQRLLFAYMDEKIRAQVTQCLVRAEPEETTRMVRAHGDAALQTQYVYRILDRARHCLGNPERIEVEPLFFRYALTDAFYRWVVAVRDVDSLLPAA